MAFIIVPKQKNPTTNQIAVSEKPRIPLKAKPALLKTIAAVNKITKILTKATKRICGGYLPGYFPPKEAAPHGKPAASANWNKDTMIVKKEKRKTANVIMVNASTYNDNNTEIINIYRQSL